MSKFGLICSNPSAKSYITLIHLFGLIATQLPLCKCLALGPVEITTPENSCPSVKGSFEGKGNSPCNKKKRLFSAKKSLQSSFLFTPALYGCPCHKVLQKQPFIILNDLRLQYVWTQLFWKVLQGIHFQFPFSFSQASKFNTRFLETDGFLRKHFFHETFGGQSMKVLLPTKVICGLGGPKISSKIHVKIIRSEDEKFM